MELTDGGKRLRNDITPLNTTPPGINAKSQLSSTIPPPHTTPSNTKGDQTSAGSINDTVNIKPDVDLLGELRSMQRPLKPRIRPKTDTVMVPNAGRMLSALIPRQTSTLSDRKAAYRRWLEDKTKDDLIDLILSLEGREPISEITEQVPKTPSEKSSGEASEGYKIPADLPYMRLPIMRRTGVNEPAATWRIVLVGLDQISRPIGLQIDSEITIGRAGGDASPDLDLTPFGAKNKGVSRIHALLRPQMDSLLLIDMDSSNGTFWNRLRLPTQTTQPLKEGDVIAFGRVNFLVKIVKSPNAHDTRTLL